MFALMTGHEYTTTVDLGNIHPRLKPPARRLQLPPSPSPTRRFGHIALLRRAAQRCPLARDLPTLRDPLLYRYLYLYRVTPCAHRPDPGICGIAR